MNHRSTWKGWPLIRQARFCLTLIVLFGIVPAACTRQPPVEDERHELKGKVVNVDKRGRLVTIAHDSIPGYMDAMAMPFKLKDEWAYDELATGDKVQATLVIRGEESWLEGIVFVRDGPDSTRATAPESVVGPPLGVEVPDFTLVNQDGKRIHLRQYRGQALVLTFIYTRCPLPDYCPLMTQRFSEIRRALEPVLADEVHLLSISVDPKYDKPARLREFGKARAALESFNQWEFASGTEDEVKKVATWFGMQYWEEGDQIIHSLRTAVIGPDGKLAALYHGNDWKPEDVLTSIRNLNLNN